MIACSRTLFVALALSFGFAGTIQAQSAIDGEWEVSYLDHVLGVVSGKAKVDGANATIELRHPIYGEIYNLTSTEIRVSDRDIEIVLNGMSPFPEELPDGLHDPATALIVHPDGGTLRLAHGENEATHVVAPRNETDIDRVTLKLRLAEDGKSLYGQWTYRIDRYLDTDIRGLGRHGDIEERDGSWFASSMEVWTRPQVQLAGAISLQHQMKQEVFSDGTVMPYFGFPWSGSTDPGLPRRWIFVFGRNLPTDYSRPLKIEAVDPGVIYSMLYRQSDIGRSSEAAELYTRGWQKVRDRLKADGRSDTEIESALGSMTAVILTANLSREAVPGYNSLKLDNSEAAWLLQYGDNVGSMRFVRRTGPYDHDFEQVHFAFAGERIAIEIRTNIALPVKTIPVIVGLNGQPVLKGNAVSTGIVAVQSAENPRIYRTDLIQMDPWLDHGEGIMAGGAAPWHRIGTGQGDQITAVIAQPGLFSIAPNAAATTVFTTPTDTAIGGTWSMFLATAAQCAGVALTGGANAERMESNRISEFLLNTGRYRIPVPGWMATKVSIGQHAAMLLLRDTFLRMMLQNETQLRRYETDQDLALYRRSIENLVRQGQHPLSRIEVTGPDNIKTDFIWTFEGDIVAQVTGIGRTAIDEWAIAATRDALDQQRAMMTMQIAKVQEIDDCAIEQLLRLTGYSFGPVAEIAASKLMVRGPAPQYWVPDARPRAYVETVALVADQLRIQDRLGEADAREATMAIGFATIPVAIGGALVGSGSAAIAVALVDITDISLNLYEHLGEKWTRDAEVQFALATATVLGMRRLETAETRRLTWAHVILNKILYEVGPAAVGLGFDLPGLVKVFREGMELRRIARGQQILRAATDAEDATTAAARRIQDNDNELTGLIQESRLPDSGVDLRAIDPTTGPPSVLRNAVEESPLRLNFDEISDLASRSGDDIFAALDNIDPADLARAVDETDPFRAAAIADGTLRPRWADEFSPADFQRIRNLVTNTDILRLLDEAGDAIATTLRNADELRRDYAWRLLEFEPGLTAQQYANRLNDLVSEAPRPRGEDFFNQASPDDLDVALRVEHSGWRTELDPAVGGITIRDPSGNYGYLARAYEAATETATMSMAFRRYAGSPGRIAGTMENIARVPAFGNRIVTMDFFQMRMFSSQGVRYGAAAGAEGAIRKVVMEHIANPTTLVTTNWWKRTYFPGIPWDEIPAQRISDMLMSTHSVDYARRTLAAMGYRVKGARVTFDGAASHNRPLEVFSRWFQSSSETWQQFVARHRIDPEAGNATASFNIELDVAPW
ncbi:MAG: hypothetical protein WD711_11965 [Dongiaceae bacterium]